MAYTQKTWVDGEIIYHQDLNRMEQGIADAHNIPVYNKLPPDRKALPNVIYNFGTEYPSEIYFAEEGGNFLKVWCFILQTLENQEFHDINWNGYVRYWVRGSAPSLQPNTYYEIRVINGIGRYIEVPLGGGGGGDDASDSYNDDFNSDF